MRIGFAAGSKESSQNAVIGRIVEVAEPGDSPVFTVRLADGTTKTVVADAKTKGSLPPSSLSVGDYVEMDLDGTDYAVALRWVNPLVSLGTITANINKTAVNKPESLVNRFSYTYGYLMIKSLAQQGLYFDMDYYVRGTLDAIQVAASKPITDFLTEDEMNDTVKNTRTKYGARERRHRHSRVRTLPISNLSESWKSPPTSFRHSAIRTDISSPPACSGKD